MNALGFNITGSENTATGNGALFNNNASGNTANGANALLANTTGFDNTATVKGALEQHIAQAARTLPSVPRRSSFNSTGDGNTAGVLVRSSVTPPAISIQLSVYGALTGNATGNQ